MSSKTETSSSAECTEMAVLPQRTETSHPSPKGELVTVISLPQLNTSPKKETWSHKYKTKMEMKK
jgi:hypothetical protein